MTPQPSAAAGRFWGRFLFGRAEQQGMGRCRIPSLLSRRSWSESPAETPKQAEEIRAQDAQEITAIASL